MNYITDSNFKNLSVVKESCNNTDKLVTPDWRVKTAVGGVSAVVGYDNGMRIDAYYPIDGYIYVRQIIPNILQFSGKKLKVKVTIDRLSWQELGYDIYIQARFNSKDTDRILVVDTQTKPLRQGVNVIELDVQVPVLTKSTFLVGEGNGLSVAFRLIGRQQHTAFTVKSIEVVVEESVASIKLTQEQYEAVCLKLRELL